MSTKHIVVSITARVLLPTCLFLLLAACVPLHGLITHWGREAEYHAPELNPRPTRKLLITGTNNPRVKLTFWLNFSTNKVGCRDLRLGAPFPSEHADRRSSGSEEKFTIEFYLDNYLPGACDWRLAGLQYHLTVPDIAPKATLVRQVAFGEGGPDSHRVELMCGPLLERSPGRVSISLGCSSEPKPVLSTNGARVEVSVSTPAMSMSDGRIQEDFFREMLSPRPTENTTRFNAYLDKLSLLRSFPAFAKNAGADIRALAIIGPLGSRRADSSVAHTYHVMTFVREGNGTRLNYLAMSGGSIVYKKTRLLGTSDTATLLSDLLALPGLSDRGLSAAEIAATLPDNGLGDFRFNILAGDFSSLPRRVKIADISTLSRWTIPKRATSGTRDQWDEFLDLLHAKLESTYQRSE